VALVANPDGPVATTAELVIAPHTGPEVIAGSTRMKAGTAQKMVLNMLSTASFARLGKVYGNLMVDLRASNEKLRLRARRIVEEATGVSPEQAERLLHEANGSAKLAVVMALAGAGAEEAGRLLQGAGGSVRLAVEGREV
jgi:N-acetylmuramic acid 6-phosphate etherase